MVVNRRREMGNFQRALAHSPGTNYRICGLRVRLAALNKESERLNSRVDDHDTAAVLSFDFNSADSGSSWPSFRRSWQMAAGRFRRCCCPGNRFCVYKAAPPGQRATAQIPFDQFLSE